MKTSKTFKIGQVVNYKNGGLSVYTGKIVKIKENTLVVIDDLSGMELFNSGYSVGDEITFNQLIFSK